MTSKADFSEEEWTRIKRAPFVAGTAISLADPGGPIELVKETAATLKSVRSAADASGRGDLVDAIAQEVVADTAQRKNPLHDFKPRARSRDRRSSRSSRRSTAWCRPRRRRRRRMRSGTGS